MPSWDINSQNWALLQVKTMWSGCTLATGMALLTLSRKVLIIFLCFCESWIYKVCHGKLSLINVFTHVESLQDWSCATGSKNIEFSLLINHSVFCSFHPLTSLLWTLQNCETFRTFSNISAIKADTIECLQFWQGQNISVSSNCLQTSEFLPISP